MTRCYVLAADTGDVMAGPTTPTEQGLPTPARAVLVVALIYIFLVGVSMLESGIKVMGADTQASLFESVNNPIAGLFVGILGTVLVQSSSASTSVVVGLVASGALGGAERGTERSDEQRRAKRSRPLPHQSHQ